MVIQSVKSVTALPGSAAVYQVTYSTGTVSYVPQDAMNRDYAAVVAWTAAGGVIG